MTMAQWIFHYLEVTKYQNKLRKEQFDLIETLINIFDSRIDLLLAFIDMDLFNKWQEVRNKKIDANNEVVLSESDEELLKFLQSAPKVLTIPDSVVKEQKFILPKYHRRKPKLGIEPINNATDVHNSTQKEGEDIDGNE